MTRISRQFWAFAAFVAGPLGMLVLGTTPKTQQGLVQPEKGMRQNPYAQIIAAPAVRVSQANSSKPHWEVQIASDPTDSKRLIACSILFNDDRMNDPNTYLRPYPTNIVVYTSVDGGLNWALTFEIDKHQHNVDPTCAFGPDGSAYLMAFGGDVYGLVSWGRQNRHDSRLNKTLPADAFFRMPMYRSIDGARTWQKVGEAAVADREYITIDDTTGKYRGRVYVHGANGVAGIDGKPIDGLTVAFSTDRGQTYKSLELADDGTQSVIGDANGIVMSDGTFGMAFGDLVDQRLLSNHMLHPTTPNTKLKFISSNDGGESFNRASIISDWYLRRNGRLNEIPSLAVDRSQSPFHDRLYVGWVDVRSGRGQIRFAYSKDKGKTWSSSFVISDNWSYDEQGEAPDAFMPVLAVNRDGVVGVLWYDRRDHPDNLGYDIRFSASLDGGESFLPSVLVSKGGGSALQMKYALLQGPWLASSDADGRARGEFNWFKVVETGGDTAGLACDLDGVFHALWIDRLSGVQQVSTTRISVNRRAMRNGGAGLESLSDLSSKAEVRYSLAHLDFATKVITIGAAISNESREPIPGHLTLRLLGLSSSNGPIEALNADNGISAGGAVWRFDSATGQLLPPHALSVPRELQFKLARDPFPPAMFGVGPDRDLVRLDTKIIGATEGKSQ